MATRCVIGIIRNDGSVECISCHYDGYVLGVGEMLNEYYKDQEKIERLLELGNISTLGENVEPLNGTEHSFEKPDDHTTIAYARDRGDKKVESKVMKDLNEFSKKFNESWCEYAYLFDEKNQTWLCNTTTIFEASDLKELSDFIEDKQKRMMDYGLKLN